MRRAYATGPCPSVRWTLKLDLVALEQQVLARWREARPLRPGEDLRKGGRPWVFYEGPPTANGRPGLHHVWARVFKDLYPRFQTMRGADVPRKGGWDCHGLPVELEIEKELGFHPKDDIEAYGIANFNDAAATRCSATSRTWPRSPGGRRVDRHQGRLLDPEQRLHRVGVVAGAPALGQGPPLRGPPCRPLLRSLRHRPVVPRGGARLPRRHRPVRVRALPAPPPASTTIWATPTCSCGRPLRGRSSPTSRPRSVPTSSTCACATTAGGRDLIMAASARSPTTPKSSSVSPVTTSSAVVITRPFDHPAHRRHRRARRRRRLRQHRRRLGHRAHRARVRRGRHADGPRRGSARAQPGRPRRAFDHTVPPYTGRFVKDADEDIIADLDRRGLLVRREPYVHGYPHCWRCGTPLIYWAKTSWFVRTSDAQGRAAARERAHQLASRTTSATVGSATGSRATSTGRSRATATGAPRCPIWRCAEGHDTCIGSVAELGELAGHGPRRPRPAPAVRRRRHLRVPAPRVLGPGHPAGAGARRVVRLGLDAVGPAPLSRSPTAAPSRRRFPADFICEAIDQTRGWFYSLLAVNTLVFGETPYRDVVCLGHIVDADGQKMSKSRGNVIDPWHIFSTFGADALRWYFFSSGSAVDPRRVSEEGIRESTRQTLLTLWNVFSFFVDLRRPRRLVPDGEPPQPTHVLDRWVLDQLDDTIAAVTGALERLRRAHRRHPAGRRSSTTSPTGMCAGQPPAVLEGAATPPPMPTLHHVPRRDRTAPRAVLSLPRRRALHHV